VKVGDLVQHRDGEVGLLIEVNSDDHLYPYKVFFQSKGGSPLEHAWYNVDYIVGVVSESR